MVKFLAMGHSNVILEISILIGQASSHPKRIKIQLNVTIWATNKLYTGILTFNYQF